MRVRVPSALHGYTAAAAVCADGATLGAVLDGLDRRHPGLRFRIVDEQARIRRHIRLFIAGEQAHDLDRPVRDDEELIIVLALSGG